MTGIGEKEPGGSTNEDGATQGRRQASPEGNPLDGALAQLDVAFVKEDGMFRRSHAYDRVAPVV